MLNNLTKTHIKLLLQFRHFYIRTKMKYGFVTFARPCDAFTAIDDSPKNSAICHYDISFGGRRAFCREKYFDLGKLIGNYRNFLAKLRLIELSLYLL